MLTKGYNGKPRLRAEQAGADHFPRLDLAEELEGSGVRECAASPRPYVNTTMVREGGITPISTVGGGGKRYLHLAAATMWPARAGCC